MKIQATMRNVLGTALLALTLLGLTGCPWSQAVSSYAEVRIYNHVNEAKTGDPTSTPCTKGLRVAFYDFYEEKIVLVTEAVQPGQFYGPVGPFDNVVSPRYQNPHYRIEAYCITDSQTGKSVREVQGKRLIFEIRPPNFMTGENPDEVTPPGPWIIEKGLLP